MSFRSFVENRRDLLVMAALLTATLVVSLSLQWLSVPAPFLLGSLLTAIGFSLRGIKAQVPRPLFLFSQGAIGVSVAGWISPEALHGFATSWPLFVGLTIVMIFVAYLIGVVVSRRTSIPVDAAIWGGLPGMASMMVAAAHQSGADSRLVAFIQYVRVAEVVLVATVVSHFLAGDITGVGPHVGSADPLAMAVTIAIACLAIPAARIRWMPAAPILVAITAGSALQLNGAVQVSIPNWLLLGANITLGIQIGLLFTRQTIEYVTRIIPPIVVSSAVLILISAIAAYGVSQVMHVDQLTAFLATAPGSIDMIAIIAMTNHANVSFVLAHQVTRLLLVVLIGPILARRVTRQVKYRESKYREAGD